jgi:AcrR family transcriptional regulator
MTPSVSQSSRQRGQAVAGRPLRRDAARNRQRILRAAAEVFTEHGLQASLDDVARHAGVGVGTVYRRFPDKEALAEALFEERLGALVGLAEQALAEPDEWVGLVSFLENAGALLAADRGLRQIVMFATYSCDRVGEARARLQPVVTKLVTRAQAAGAVRADLRPTDVPLIEFMLAAVADYARQHPAARGGAQPGRDRTGHAHQPAAPPLTRRCPLRPLPAAPPPDRRCPPWTAAIPASAPLGPSSTRLVP